MCLVDGQSKPTDLYGLYVTTWGSILPSMLNDSMSKSVVTAMSNLLNISGSNSRFYNDQFSSHQKVSNGICKTNREIRRQKHWRNHSVVVPRWWRFFCQLWNRNLSWLSLIIRPYLSQTLSNMAPLVHSAAVLSLKFWFFFTRNEKPHETNAEHLTIPFLLRIILFVLFRQRSLTGMFRNTCFKILITTGWFCKYTEEIW